MPFENFGHARRSVEPPSQREPACTQTVSAANRTRSQHPASHSDSLLLLENIQVCDDGSKGLGVVMGDMEGAGSSELGGSDGGGFRASGEEVEGVVKGDELAPGMASETDSAAWLAMSLRRRRRWWRSARAAAAARRDDVTDLVAAGGARRIAEKHLVNMDWQRFGRGR